ncbi:hypothetical protein MMC13_007338 [Lambiella insularis]|nr:hypothetical protein [Lambiella insularis]
MASPAASAGELIAPAPPDPWDWTVDDVVTALCSPTGLLRQISPVVFPDPASLARVIQEQRMHGLVLLRCASDAVFLEQKMGLTAAGDRIAVLDTVSELQDQSTKFGNHQMRQASRMARSSFGPGSMYGDNTSPFPPQYNPQLYPMMPPLNRWLSESVQSIQNRALQGSGTRPLDESEYEQSSSRLPMPGSPDQAVLMRPTQPLQAPDRPLEATNEKAHDNPLATGQEDGWVSQSTDPDGGRKIGEDPVVPERLDDIATVLRAGESYAVDGNGRKRRRLALEPTSPVAADDNFNTTRHVGGIDDILRVLEASPQTVVGQSSATATTSFANDSPSVLQDDAQADDISPPIDVDRNDSTPLPVTELQAPGTVIVDAQGRKRMKPILLVPEIAQDQSDDSAATAVPVDLKPELDVTNASVQMAIQKHASESEAQSQAAKRSASRTYLGLHALAVDSVFYGNTPMGHEVQYTDDTGTIEQFEGVVDETRVDGPTRVHNKSSENWFLSSPSMISNGRRLYANNRLRFFLRSAAWRELGRGSERYFGIDPYPARIAKQHQRLSMTVMSDAASGFRTVRANRSSWHKDIQVRHQVQSLQEGFPASEAIDGSSNDSILSHLGENEIHDWDFLEKWNHRGDKDDVLPLYGDSGSEGELDVDTWREIEEEEKEKNRPGLERPLGPSKNKHLNHQEVKDAIEAASNELLDRWKGKKLSILETKAWRLWTKSRRDGTKQIQIESLTNNILKLEHRLSKLKKELLGEVWSKVSQIKKQCQCLERSIFDQECDKWKVGVLKLKSQPSKPQQTKKSLKVRVPKSEPESLEAGEEDLASDQSGPESSDDGLDDFIVEDEIEVDDVPLSLDNEAEVNGLDADLGANIEALNLSEDETKDSYSPRPADLKLSKDETEDSYSPRPADTETGPNEDPVSEQESESTGSIDLLNDVNDLPSSSPLLLGQRSSPGQHSLPRLARPALLDNPATSPEIIDLTQLSDAAEPSPYSPKLKIEQAHVHTPPSLKGANAFDQARRAPSTFKAPPTISNIVDMESDSSIVDDGTPPKFTKELQLPSTPTKEKLPDLQDMDGIARLENSLLIERKDRKRLLTWMLARTTFAKRKHTLETLSERPAGEVQYEVWEALRAIKGHAQRTRRPNSESYIRLSFWYISWHMCKVYERELGVPTKDVENAIANETGFHEFHNFIVERLDAIQIHDTAKEGAEKEKLRAESKNRPSSSPFMGSHRKGEKKQKRIFDDLDAGGSSSTLHKRRKYVVLESQEGVEMRNRARERAQERSRRQEMLSLQMRSMSAFSGDTTTMIVNGKSGDEMIAVNPEIGKRIQPHQMEGVQFMWGEIVADDEERQGCLLAHTMGLGKTMQVITLLVTIAEAANHSNELIRNQIPEALRESRTLVLCPPSLVNNWSDELMMWRPSSVNIGEIRKISALLKVNERVYEIQEWAEHGGVLLIGYDMFKGMVQNKPRKSKDGPTNMLDEAQHEKICFNLLELPNLIIADEAHALKKEKTDVSLAVQKLRSKRRIALTGSPLANNLEEYYTIINWIAPNYLGSRPEFRDKYVEPIRDGLYADATQSQKRKGLQRLLVLKSELAPKVHRADIAILHERLKKGKTEFVLRVPLTALQYDAYKLYVEHALSATSTKEPGFATLWAWLAILRLLCNHPLCFRDKLLQEDEDVKPSKKPAKAKPKKAERSFEDPEGLEEDVEELLEGSVTSLGLTKALVDKLLARFKAETTPLDTPSLSNKIKMLWQILQFSKAVGDKVLVFSHSIATLDYVEKLLVKKRWSYLRLDGKTRMQARQQLTKDFNSTDMQVCLISTRAGGQGLNLFGANRVVIMDDTFNPMYEEQAIGRAYRIGQEKHVYVYRLTIGGTFEQALQDQSLLKIQLATRVVDKKNPMRHALKGARQYLFLPKEVEQKDLRGFLGTDTAVLDRIMGIDANDSVIRSIDLTETFHQEVEEPLTAEEEREAKQMASDERLRRTDPAAYEKVRVRRLAELAEQQAKALRPIPAPMEAQTFVLNPNLNMETPPASSAMTNREWEELRLKRQKQAELHSLPSLTHSLASSAQVRPSGDLPGMSEILAAATRAAMAPSPVTAPSTSRSSNNIRVQTRSSDSMDPVLGLNTRIRERSLPESPERDVLPHTQDATSSRNAIPRGGASERGSPIPSIHSRASTEPFRNSLTDLQPERRDQLRRDNESVLANVIWSEMALGTITVPNVPEVAAILSESMDRHAYKNACSVEHYHVLLATSIGHLREPGRDFQGIITQAQRRLAKNSTSRSGSRSALEQETRLREAPVSGTPAGELPATPVPGHGAESVGVTVPSPITPLPLHTTSSYPSSVGLLDRETNRKPG